MAKSQHPTDGSRGAEDELGGAAGTRAGPANEDEGERGERSKDANVEGEASDENEDLDDEGEDEDEDLDDEGDDDEDADEEAEIEVVLAVARLDLEASAAYETALQAALDPKLAELLRAFASDHRRHAEDFHRYVESLGYEVDEPGAPESSVLVMLAAAVGNLDPEAALEAMMANEHLTNGTYETALWLIGDEEALAIVRRNREDERRHLDALRAYAATLE